LVIVCLKKPYPDICMDDEYLNANVDNQGPEKINLTAVLNSHDKTSTYVTMNILSYNFKFT
jgi:hypothetical protein